MRLAVAIWRFWYNSGYIREGLQLFDKAFEHITTPPPLDLRAEAYLAACGLAWACGELSQADKYRESAFSKFRNLKDETGLARTYNLWGVILEQQKAYQQARNKYQQSLNRYERLDNKLGMARALGNLGVVTQREGKYKSAAKYYERCLALFGKIGDEAGQATALFNLGEVHLLLGNPSEAYRKFDESLILSQKIPDLVNIIYCLEGFIWVTYKQDKLQVAASLRWAAVTLRNEIEVPLPKAEGFDYEKIADEVKSQLDPKARNATTLQGLCIARLLRERTEAADPTLTVLSLEQILAGCQPVDEQS